MDKLARRSHLFKIFFQCFFYVIPVVTAFAWITHQAYSDLLISLNDKTIHVTPLLQFLGFLINMISSSVAMYAVYQLIQLFRQYEQNNIFTEENVNRYRLLGFALIWYVLSDWLTDLLISFLVTFTRSPFHMNIGLTLVPHDFIAIIIGAIIILISWVMSEGQKISTDHAQII